MLPSAMVCRWASPGRRVPWTGTSAHPEISHLWQVYGADNTHIPRNSLITNATSDNSDYVHFNVYRMILKWLRVIRSVIRRRIVNFGSGWF